MGHFFIFTQDYSTNFFRKCVLCQTCSFCSDSRGSLLRLLCQDNDVDMSEQEWTELAELTNGYSGSDLTHMVQEALFEPIRDMQNARYWKYTPGSQIV